MQTLKNNLDNILRVTADIVSSLDTISKVYDVTECEHCSVFKNIKDGNEIVILSWIIIFARRAALLTVLHVVIFSPI